MTGLELRGLAWEAGLLYRLNADSLQIPPGSVSVVGAEPTAGDALADVLLGLASPVRGSVLARGRTVTSEPPGRRAFSGGKTQEPARTPPVHGQRQARPDHRPGSGQRSRRETHVPISGRLHLPLRSPTTVTITGLIAGAASLGPARPKGWGHGSQNQTGASQEKSSAPSVAVRLTRASVPAVFSPRR